MSADFELHGTDRWPSIVDGIPHGPYPNLATEHPEWLQNYLNRHTEDYGISREQYVEQLESEWQHDQTSEAIHAAQNSDMPTLPYRQSLLLGKVLMLWEHWPLTPEEQIRQVTRYNRSTYTAPNSRHTTQL